MKAPTLVHLNNYHYRRGGAELVFLEQTRLLEERGWQVVPFCMHHPDNLPSPWSRHWVDEIEFGNDYSLPAKVRNAARVVWSGQARDRLGALLDTIRPDIAHLHNVYHHISPSVLGLLADRDVPIVLTTHDLKVVCPSYTMLTHDGICERCKGGRLHNVVVHKCVKDSRALSTVVFVESALHRTLRSYDHVDTFVSPSRFYIDTFVEWGMDRDRFVHIPNHVDADRFAPEFTPGRDVVYFGRLAPEKGLVTLIAASAASGVPVRIIGTGPVEADLHDLVASVGAPVRFEGYLTGPALHDAVRSARAVVLPSEWYENGPVSLLEAYALGKPVVGARIGGITEMVREEHTGFGFASSSVDDLAAVLDRVRSAPDAAIEEMGRAGRAWVEDDFSAVRHVERLADVYAALGVASP